MDVDLRFVTTYKIDIISKLFPDLVKFFTSLFFKVLNDLMGKRYLTKILK